MRIVGLLALSLCLVGCSANRTASRVGKYVYAVDLKFKSIPFTQKFPSEWVELKPDGTYAAQNGRLKAAGRYTIQGTQIQFTAPTGSKYHGHFRDEVLELHDSCFGIRLSSSNTSPEDYFTKEK